MHEYPSARRAPFGHVDVVGLASEKPVTAVRTVAGVGVGTAALLSVLAGCSADTKDGTLGMAAPISAASATPSAVQPGANQKRNTGAPASTLFGGSTPVSIVSWWKQHPSAAPADLSQRVLLFNHQGTGPQRFPGPDMRKYSKVLMVITCTSKVEYLVRLQVLDGLSIASTSGTSCGGPTLSAYISPFVKVVEPKTEVEVQIADGVKYFVTMYGTRAAR